MPEFFSLDEIDFREYEPALLPLVSSSAFDCGNVEFNDFLKRDVDFHCKERLAQTMLILHRNRLIGYFCLLADAINLSDVEAEAFRKRGINYRSFPAIKIGRLGVDVAYQRKRVGVLAVKVIVGIVNKAQRYFGSRFLTVDSKLDPRTIAFWEGLGFVQNLKQNVKGRETVSYRYDLLNPLPK